MLLDEKTLEIQEEYNNNEFDGFIQCDCELIKIKAMVDHWALYFKNDTSLYKIPIYRLPEYKDKENFINFKVGYYYKILLNISPIFVNDLIRNKEI